MVVDCGRAAQRWAVPRRPIRRRDRELAVFHDMPRAIAERMAYLESVDSRDRLDGTPRLERLRQVPPQTGRLPVLSAGPEQVDWKELRKSQEQETGAALGAFLEFVLSHYIQEGFEELDQDHLSPLLELRYSAIQDAIQDLGPSPEIHNMFIDFQQYLY